MQSKEEQALCNFLRNQGEFALALRLNYEQVQGQLFLVPDGLGGWSTRSTDTHPLALPLPKIDQDEYRALQKFLASTILDKYALVVLASWSKIRWLAEDASNPFWNPDAIV